jgi:hypothetical protein
VGLVILSPIQRSVWFVAKIAVSFPNTFSWMKMGVSPYEPVASILLCHWWLMLKLFGHVGYSTIKSQKKYKKISWENSGIYNTKKETISGFLLCVIYLNIKDLFARRP